MSKSSLEAATEAAAKVNAMLVAKGKLKIFPHSKPKAGGFVGLQRPGSGDLITAEVDINDAPLSARNLLTRGHTQDEICKYSGAAISTRGRYMTIEERQALGTSDGRPLYLHVQAAKQHAVDVAVKRIQDIINQHVLASGGVKSPTVGNVTYPLRNISNGATPLTGSTPLSSGPHYVQDKVFVGLEQAPHTYPVREKILGPGGSFLQHIRTETAATITLRGKGSGYIEPTSGREAFEPLYIHITHPKLEGLNAAKALAVNLVETAHVEYAQWQQQQSVIQSVTPVIIPQGTTLAYQNQVLVTPAVIPVATKSLPSSSGVVATRLPVPGVGVSVPGVALPSNLPSIVQNSITIPGSIGVPPVSVVTSIPVSVQGIPSQAVITYPTTYVSDHNQVLSGTATARSLVDVSSHLPVSSAYTAATSQTSLSPHLGTLSVSPFTSSVQPVAFPQPVTYSTVDPHAHLNPASVPNAVVLPPNSTNYTSSVPLSYVSNTSTAGLISVTSAMPSAVVQTSTTAYPHIPYPRTESEGGKRKFCEEEENNTEKAPDVFPRLQESNSNPSTDSETLEKSASLESNCDASPDEELMPPPPVPQHVVSSPRKSVPAVYASDDSSDDEGSLGSPSSKNSTSEPSIYNDEPAFEEIEDAIIISMFQPKATDHPSSLSAIDDEDDESIQETEAKSILSKLQQFFEEQSTTNKTMMDSVAKLDEELDRISDARKTQDN